jgi:DNA-binding MarR family transcriptional regulator
MAERLELLGRGLSESIDRLIRRASVPRVHQRLNAAAGVRLDRSSYWLASWLADSNGLRLSELADVLHMDLSTVSRQVQSAERGGLVDRVPDPSDGRASLVRLTPAGYAALERIRGVQRAEILAAIDDWPTEDQQSFARLMDRFSAGFLAWAGDDIPAPREAGPTRTRV